MSTAACVKFLNTLPVDPIFEPFRQDDSGKWKRFKKFKYRGKDRRYFVKEYSGLIGVVDEDKDGTLTGAVRAPSVWEWWMVGAKINEDIHDEVFDLYEGMVVDKINQYMDPAMYGFYLSNDTNYWGDDKYTLFIYPLIMDDNDQHLGEFVPFPNPTEFEEDCEAMFSYHGPIKDRDALIDHLTSYGFFYNKNTSDIFDE